MFLNEMHQIRFNQLLRKDQTYTGDTERKAVFFIIAGNNDLFLKSDFIYDFEERVILPENLTNGKVDFSQSSRNLIRLAFNLYNSYEGVSVIDTFCGLDETNFALALNAIRMRFYQYQYQ
mgnify:CR=1 FL=1